MEDDEVLPTDELDAAMRAVDAHYGELLPASFGPGRYTVTIDETWLEEHRRLVSEYEQVAERARSWVRDRQA